jgi:hypothetical protein
MKDEGGRMKKNGTRTTQYSLRNSFAYAARMTFYTRDA